MDGLPAGGQHGMVMRSTSMRGGGYWLPGVAATLTNSALFPPAHQGHSLSVPIIETTASTSMLLTPSATVASPEASAGVLSATQVQPRTTPRCPAVPPSTPLGSPPLGRCDRGALASFDTGAQRPVGRASLAAAQPEALPSADVSMMRAAASMPLVATPRSPPPLRRAAALRAAAHSSRAVPVDAAPAPSEALPPSCPASGPVATTWGGTGLRDDSGTSDPDPSSPPAHAPPRSVPMWQSRYTSLPCSHSGSSSNNGGAHGDFLSAVSRGSITLSRQLSMPGVAHRSHSGRLGRHTEASKVTQSGQTGSVTIFRTSSSQAALWTQRGGAPRPLSMHSRPTVSAVAAAASAAPDLPQLDHLESCGSMAAVDGGNMQRSMAVASVAGSATVEARAEGKAAAGIAVEQALAQSDTLDAFFSNPERALGVPSPNWVVHHLRGAHASAARGRREASCASKPLGEGLEAEHSPPWGSSSTALAPPDSPWTPLGWALPGRDARTAPADAATIAAVPGMHLHGGEHVMSWLAPTSHVEAVASTPRGSSSDAATPQPLPVSIISPVAAALSQWLPSPFNAGDHSVSCSDTVDSGSGSELFASRSLLDSIRARLWPQRAPCVATPRSACASPMPPVVEAEGAMDGTGLSSEDSLFLPAPPNPVLWRQVCCLCHCFIADLSCGLVLAT
jgi:hypothetical protein